MKKVFATILAASLMLLGTQAFGQISVKAGYMNASDKAAGETAGLNGVFAGAFYDLGLDFNGFGIEPGVEADLLFGDSSHKELALAIPINVTYSYDLTSDYRIKAYAGPAIQFGLLKKTDDLNWYDNDGLKRLNVLLGLGVGYEVSDYLNVYVGADFGLLDLAPSNAGFKYTRPYQLRIGVGYSF